MMVLLKLGLGPSVPNRNLETEFWVNEKKIALLFCQPEEGYISPKDRTPLERGDFLVLGVENRATDKDQGRGTLALILVVLLLLGMKNASSSS